MNKSEEKQKSFDLQIYAEDGVFYEGICYELILPCEDGEKGFLPLHEESVYAVYNGTLRFLVPDGEKAKIWRNVVIGKGVTHFAHNACVVLAETAERPEDIDKNRAQAAFDRAQEKMQKELSMREYRISQMAMSRAIARIRGAKKPPE